MNPRVGVLRRRRFIIRRLESRLLPEEYFEPAELGDIPLGGFGVETCSRVLYLDQGEADRAFVGAGEP